MTLLEIDAVRKRYGHHDALRGLSLKVHRGEIVCLLGASGSGKTTLLRLVAGLERVDRGRIVLDGAVVDAPGTPGLPSEKRRLGMVFQDYALWPHMTALENVALPLRARSGRDVRAQALRMLERVGLKGLEERRPHELSGGQQQRVALARALAVRQRLLLCDEPLSNLDAGLREELRELIGSVVREHGLSALTITHDRREALALADRVGVMEAGRLLQIDAPRELWRRPHCEAVARFTDAFGPWTVRLENGILHAPWGACRLQPGPEKMPPTGSGHLYLRARALRFESAANGSWTAHARVLGSVVTGDGVELRCDLHGVTLRMPATEAPPAGAKLVLAIDPAQSLLYPTETDQESPSA